MNKAELITAVAEKTGLSKKDSEKEIGRAHVLTPVTT